MKIIGLIWSFNEILLFLISLQFETDAIMDTTLSMSEDLYNSKYKEKLDPDHKVITY